MKIVKAQKKKVVQEDSDSQHSDEENNESLSGDDAGEVKADGMAEMMSKILNQNVNGKIPVLSKRKTATMKEIEGDIENRNKVKKARVEKSVQRNKQLATPDVLTVDYERQLRKLATRGVVTLFNAIAKSKRESEELQQQNSNSTSKLGDKNKKKKKISQEEFMGLLKVGNREINSLENANSNNNEGEIEGSNEKTKKNSNSSSVDKVDEKWSALRDDFMLDPSMKLKDWDKDTSSDEDEEKE